jgi:hypothetical protein
MGVVIQFNYGNWAALFPQFSRLSQAQVTQYWQLATAFVRNDGGGPVNDPNIQTNLLNLVTAHMCALLGPYVQGADGSPGQPGNPLVGRISNASEGSVSVAADMPNQPQAAAFWQQSQYGAMFWAISAPFRLMRYIPGPVRNQNPWPIWPQGYFNSNGAAIAGPPGWGGWLW